MVTTFDSTTSLLVAEKIKELVGQKFTLAKYGDFGFLQTLHAELQSIEVKDYAQYRNAIYLVFKQKGKRKLRCCWLLPRHSNKVAIWKGYEEIDGRMFKKADISRL